MQSNVRTILNVSLFALFVGSGAVSCGGDDAEGGALVAPTNFKAELVAGPAVHLTWTDTPSEHHYTLERKVGTGQFKAIEPPLNFNAVQYHDADVMTGTYTYRIAGGSQSGMLGPYSVEVSAVVP
ncbi:MAG TPA: hypothetical protein VGG33_06280 [Polyangia bacterium]